MNWKGKLVAGAALLFTWQLALADIVWDWSSDGEVGTFTTTGSNLAPLGAGTFSIIDFAVSATDDGIALGSVGGGDYIFGAGAAPSLTWDGSAVTVLDDNDGSFPGLLFISDGSNVLQFAASSLNVILGGTTPKGAQPMSIAPRLTGTASEPATLALGLVGLAAFGLRRRKLKA